MAKKDDVVSAELKSGLDDLMAGRLTALDNAVNVHTALQSLLLNEAQRIQTRFGAEDHRAKEIANRAQANIQRLQQLQIESQVTGIRIPEVVTDEGLIYGRVVDQDGLGIDRLIVYLMDASGARINITASTTDGAGFFAIVLDSDALGRIHKSSPNGISVAVSTPRGRLIFTEPNPITPTTGLRLLLEIRLNRIDLSASPTPDKTVVTPDVVGKYEKDAYALLNQVGLQATKSEKNVTTDQAGRVIAQNPGAGTRVAPGASITLIIGVTPDVVTVPNLVGGTLRTARAQLKTAELVLGKTSGPNPTNTSVVEKQSPGAGTPVAKGTAVDVTVAPQTPQ